MTNAPVEETTVTTGSSAGRRFGAFWDWLSPLLTPARRIDVVGGVTLVALFLTTEETWVMQIGVVALGAAAVVDRRLLRHAAYWFAVLAVYVVGMRGVVLTIDNHEFLFGYWLLALGLSRLRPDPVGSLATSARLLIGFAFAFATLWKLATPDYMSGNMFHSILLFEPRFAGVGPAVSDLTVAEGFANYRLFEALLAIGDASVTVPVVDAPGVRTLALVMTWWTVAIEGLVAVCFLAPPRWLVGRARHLALLLFLATTYVLAPVMGFGWLLVAMGVAQAPLEKHRWLLPGFAVAFLIVLVRSTAPLARIFGLLFPDLG